MSFETALASVGLNVDNSEQSNGSDSGDQESAQSDPDPLTNIQVLEKRGWLGSLFQNRRWSPKYSNVDYEVDDDGFLTGETFIRVMGSSGSIELISSGGLSILRLPKYVKYLRGIKSTRDALKFAVKSSDAFKLISGGNRFKAVIEGGALGAGQFFTQLLKNGWSFEKSGKNIKLLKDGETIIFRGSSAKKGFDTFTLPKAYEGKNVDIFFK
ncbi:hypothetical protein [Sinomicrobium oceani]|uniref:hypothetical protein n=1 Tax=Sinomicrobium oceani TaxID=1150368 RepID=UPI0009307C7E|nr:hypothetical protein [Sinomicrobium oceani]